LDNAIGLDAIFGGLEKIYLFDLDSCFHYYFRYLKKPKHKKVELSPRF
jgi:hypothetical protein